jgi:hypothetical protein
MQTPTLASRSTRNLLCASLCALWNTWRTLRARTCGPCSERRGRGRRRRRRRRRKRRRRRRRRGGRGRGNLKK